MIASFAAVYNAFFRVRQRKMEKSDECNIQYAQNLREKLQRK